ncbi:MAG: FG-GAP-like repeat-containing protein, partial [Panacagrimonas sp.]
MAFFRRMGASVPAHAAAIASFKPNPFVAALRVQRLPSLRPASPRLAGPALLLGALALTPSPPARAVDVPFTTANIATTADGANSTFSADLDGDGDLDVLSASRYDDKIAWYENDGGATPAFTLRIISTTADGARSVHAADLDGDGDLDVLSASGYDDKIAWYENGGGATPGFTLRT